MPFVDYTLKARAGLKEVLKGKNVILQVIAIEMPFVDYTLFFIRIYFKRISRLKFAKF